MIHTAADILLNLSEYKDCGQTTDCDNQRSDLLFEYPLINRLGLQPPTPALLLQKYSSVIPFPQYFEDMYRVLNNMKDIDNQIRIETSQLKSAKEKLKKSKVLARQKVVILEEYLRQNTGKITSEGFELLLPYIKDLFKDSKTTVQAAWSILRYVGRELGPAELSKNLMPHLTQLFSGENSTAKHMKLYHRSFLIQLCLTIGLDAFLANFSTLLVEAVAGYKDFDAHNSTSYSEQVEEEEELFPSNPSYHSNTEELFDNEEALQPIEEGKHVSTSVICCCSV